MRAVWLVLLTPIALIALSPQGDYSLSGTVRNSVTGEAIKGAAVTLFKTPDVSESPPGPPEARHTLAGPNGEYSFTGLTKDTYSLQAQKPGFLPASYQPDDSEGGVVTIPSSGGSYNIKLTPLGVIEGTIVNQYGDDMRNVSVALFQSLVMYGDSLVNQLPTQVTNDLGHFRFYDLQPGKYYVKAMNRAGGTSRYVGENAVRFDSWQGFRPVYFGGAAVMQSATAIAIEAGTQARADFKLSVEPTYKVSGSLENFWAAPAGDFRVIGGGRQCGRQPGLAQRR